MQQPKLAPKGTPARLVQEAQIAWNRRDLSRCVEMLERAHRAVPTDLGILLQLGGTHGALYNYQAAEDAFEQAYHLAPRDKQAVQRAIEQKDVTPEILVSMAEFCERQRRLDEANSLVDRALHSNDQSEPAKLVRARLHQRAGAFEEAERELKNLLEHTSTPEIQIRAGSELGAVLDRLERYDEAMEAFMQAKDLLRPAAEGQIGPRQFQRQQFARMRQQITADQLARWFEAQSELQPPHRLALLGGHPRSGTTLLEQVVDAHPDVVSLEETTHFTDYVYAPMQRRCPPDSPILQVLDSTSSDLLNAYRERYFAAADLCLGQPVGDRLLIDKNPSLTAMIPALARVFPEISFLVALRDPRDTVLSCFLQPVLSVQRVNYHYLQLQTTAEAYAALMRTWQTVAPLLRNPYLEVRYEDMVDDLPSVATRVLEFLGVPWNDAVLSFDEHARQKPVRSPTYVDVTQKVFARSRGRWRHYEKHLAPCLPILEPFIKSLGYE